MQHEDWNFLLNTRVIRPSSVFFLLVRRQTKHGINLYSYKIVLATHDFFFYLPHNSVVILMQKQDVKSCLCGSLLVPRCKSIWGCCFIIGWMDCPSCPWSVLFCFVILSEHTYPQTTEAQMLPSHLQYSVIKCICSEYLTKMSKALTVVLD